MQTCSNSFWASNRYRISLEIRGKCWVLWGAISKPIAITKKGNIFKLVAFAYHILVHKEVRIILFLVMQKLML
jgi:hypothetical protein